MSIIPSAPTNDTTPAPLSPDREQEIRTREQAATPGPWMSDGAEIYGTLGGILMLDLWVGESLDIDNQEQSNANAAFIATARSGVPQLLAEVVRLRAEVEQRNKDLEPYEVLNPQQCPAGVHADWLVDSEHTHTCPWCELDRLRAELAARPSVPQQQDRRAS